MSDPGAKAMDGDDAAPGVPDEARTGAVSLL